MTQSDSVDALRRALAGSRRIGPATPSCLDEDTTGALASGALDGPARATALAHMATCQRCVAAVASMARVLADSRVSREIARAEGGGRARFYRQVLPLAAAALLMVLALPRAGRDREDLHRAPTITATAAPAPVSPIGVVAAAGTLRWASVAGADRYRVTLFTADGGVLYERELADTTVALPDSIHLVAGKPYRWREEARTGWNRWAGSGLVEFRVAGLTR